MEIIKDNYHKTNFDQEVTCEECKSILRITTSDTHIDDQYTVPKYYILCPLCKHANYINSMTYRY
jgi:phage FluMu protein Com